MLATNASDQPTAQALVALMDNDQQGTLLAAKVRKVGETRGSAGSKTVYGDAYVHTLVWTGFSYRALIERSDKMLRKRLNKGGYIEALARATLEQHDQTCIADACIAIQELQDWFHRVLNGAPGPGTSMLTNPTVWEPLRVNGKVVHGCRVYRGAARPEDPRAPVPGCVYVLGVKLGEIVLAPPPNGEWRPDSRPKTIAKQILKTGLPVGLYCQYRMDPDRVSELVVDDEAAKAAKAAGIFIDPDALRALFKIAP